MPRARGTRVDASHMRLAIELAGSQRTHPNPRVGAVVVDEEGTVVGEGAHIGPGYPHAEVVALDRAGAKARESTLYVTLEPCSHHGLTPPCAAAIIAARVARVVVGVIDPDPRVSGSGVSQLRDAGIKVITDLIGDEASAVDPAYFHHRRTGLPLVTLKLAITLDGSVAALDGTSKWISSEEARHDAHLLRASTDAVVIGAGTLREDDPVLTARLDDATAPQPVPVIVAGKGPLPADRRIWERSPLVFGSEPIDIPSGEVVVVGSEDGLPDPEAVARALAERGHLDVLVEGGAGLAGAWWRAGLVGRGVIYTAARIGGGRGIPALGGEFATMAQSREVNIRDVRMVGPDIRIEFE